VRAECLTTGSGYTVLYHSSAFSSLLLVTPARNGPRHLHMVLDLRMCTFPQSGCVSSEKIRLTVGTCGCCWQRADSRRAGSTPGNILECLALLETYHDLRAKHTARVQRIHAILFHQGTAALGEGALRTEQDLAGLRAAAATYLSPAGQPQIATALEVTGTLETRLQELCTSRWMPQAPGRRQGPGRAAIRGRAGHRARDYLLAGREDRFSSFRKALRFAQLDVTVYSSDRKGPPRARLSRQGPPVLRWGVYAVGKTHGKRAVRGPQDPPASLPHPGRARRRRAVRG